MKTKDRILNAGLRLFNQQGERNVSTNHIAASIDISPGNLYYHFANKQEIVYELFLRYSREVYQFLSVPDDRPLRFADKIRYFEATFQSIWDYRFLHRDLGHLLAENERLKDGYYQFTKQTLRNGKAVLKGLRDAQLMQITDEQLDALMINIWVLVTSWTSFLQAIALNDQRQDSVSEAKIKRGIYQLIHLTEPFAGPGMEHEIEALKADYLQGQSSDPLVLFNDA